MYALPTHEVCQIFMRIFRPRLCWHTLHGRMLCVSTVSIVCAIKGLFHSGPRTV